MLTSPNYDVITIDTNPEKYRIVSEVYLVYTQRKKYVPALDMETAKSRIPVSIWAGAASLAAAIERLRSENHGKIIGLEIWIEKESEEKFAKFKVNEA